jgi:hypothetical protein
MDSDLLSELRTIEQNSGQPGGIERALALMADAAQSEDGLAGLVATFEDTPSPDIARALIFVIAKQPANVPQSLLFEFSLRIASHYRKCWHPGTTLMAIGNLASYWDDVVAERFDLSQLKSLMDAYVAGTGLRNHCDLSAFEDVLGAAGRYSSRFLSTEARSKTVECLRAMLSEPDWFRKSHADEIERDQRILDALLADSAEDLSKG